MNTWMNSLASSERIAETTKSGLTSLLFNHVCIHKHEWVCVQYAGARSGFDLFLFGRRRMFLLSFHNWSAGLVGRMANMRAEQKFPLRRNQNMNLWSTSLFPPSKCVHRQRGASKHTVQTVCGWQRVDRCFYICVWDYHQQFKGVPVAVCGKIAGGWEER